VKHPAKSRWASLTIGPLVVLAMTLGCDDGSVRIAREAADRQAEQNRTMAELQHEVAAGSRQLVEEEGQARRQALEVHRDLAAGQGRLADGWDDVEAQRQQIARSRRSDSFWAAVLPPSGGVIAAVAALAFAWVVLHSLSGDDDSSAIACQLLIEQFVIPEQSPDRDPLLIADRPVAVLLTTDGPAHPPINPSPEENA
jgi:hypothetical protein